MLSVVFALTAAQGVLAQERPLPAPADPQTTAASAELGRMAVEYAARPDMPRLVVVDPDDISALRDTDAPQETISRILEVHGVDTTSAQAGRVLEWFESRPGVYTANEGINLSHAVLDARVAFFEEGRSYVCAVMPADPDFTFIIDGLTPQQNRLFINRHEFHHCSDSDLARRILAATRHDHTDDRPRAGYVVTRESLRSTAATARSETMADLNALSDMIVIDGMDIGVVTAVAAFREREIAQNGGLSHYTAVALYEFSRQIEDMEGGIDAYRALPAPARTRMLQQLCRDYCITPGAIASYIRAHGGQVESVRISENDAALGRMIGLSQRVGAAMPGSLFTAVILTDAETAELQHWNADAILRATAVLLSGRGDSALTQLDLLSARNHLLDDLRENILREPENPLHGAKIILLNAALGRQLTATAEMSPASTAPMPVRTANLGNS